MLEMPSDGPSGKPGISITGGFRRARAPGIRAAMPIASSRVLGVDQEVAAELFARLRERAVGHQPFAVAHPDAGRRRRRVQRGGGQILAARLELLRELRRTPRNSARRSASLKACSSR